MACPNCCYIYAPGYFISLQRSERTQATKFIQAVSNKFKILNIIQMKRPFESLTQLISENLERVRENQLYNFSNFDKYMVWVVGFSIGGISIILTNLTSFNEVFDYFVVKTVLSALCVSIISGIIYRWSFYKYQFHYQQIEFYLKGAYTETQMVEIEPYDLSETNDINEIIVALKTDYDLDYRFILDAYESHDDDNQAIIRDKLKKYYYKVGTQIKEEYEFTLNYIKEVDAKAFGISRKKVDKLFNQKSSRFLKIYGWITSITFLLSCISFIFVLVYLTVLY